MLKRAEVGLLLAMMIGLGGCVPATVPPQLSHTPGPPSVVTDDIYRTPLFQVRRPEGWRVINGPATEAPSVIFAAPDDTALILLTVGALPDEPPRPAVDEPLQDVRERVALNGVTVSVYGVAPAADWPAFEAVLAGVIESLEPVA